MPYTKYPVLSSEKTAILPALWAFQGGSPAVTGGQRKIVAKKVLPGRGDGN
jgi:hypothetical protein